MKKLPHIFDLGKLTNDDGGFITVAEVNDKVPFDIKRVYWTYYTPQNVVRGNHSHKKLQQIIVAVNGSIVFKLEDKEGSKMSFVLDHPSKGLYIPPGYWRTIELSENAVLLCLASELYDEDDYIRDYKTFKETRG